MRPPVIALLTDFGTRDGYAATLKAVLVSRCPGAQLVDITHEVPPQDTVAGAFILAATVPWFPPGTIFVAVVDPEVGTSRAIIAVRADDHVLIGPDNGLLTLAVKRAKRLAAVRLTNPRYWLPTVSATFQGRDVMAPAAAYLASGGSLRRLGAAAPRLTPLSLPTVRRVGSTLRGQVVHVDGFGNLITNVPAESLARRAEGKPVVVRYKRRRVRVVSSYAAGRPAELIAIAGSFGWVELAVRNGSAARLLNAARGDAVEMVNGGRG